MVVVSAIESSSDKDVEEDEEEEDRDASLMILHLYPNLTPEFPSVVFIELLLKLEEALLLFLSLIEE